MFLFFCAVQNYVALCADVYQAEKPSKVQSYTFIEQFEDQKLGICARLFKKDDDLVFAIRGTANYQNFLVDLGIMKLHKEKLTDNFMKNLSYYKHYKESVLKKIRENIHVSSMNIVKHAPATVMSLLKAYVQVVEKWVKRTKRKYPRHKLTLTGHSLGGFLAEQISINLDIPCTTFAASAASKKLGSNKFVPNPDIKRTHYRRRGDFMVVGIHPRVGRTRVITLPTVHDPYNRTPLKEKWLLGRFVDLGKSSSKDVTQKLNRLGLTEKVFAVLDAQGRQNHIIYNFFEADF